MPYDPVRCKGCAACLNPYARVDFNAKLWICPFCYTRNHFPQHYASISETNLPAELFPTYTTIEYQLQRPAGSPPAYMFVVDVCLIEEELSALKQSLTQALSLLPENASVGLITYGTHVHVHELGFDECPKSYVFRGSKEFTSQQIQDQLFRSTGGARPRPGQTNGAAVTGHQSKFPGAPRRLRVSAHVCARGAVQGLSAPCPTAGRRDAREPRWRWPRRCSLVRLQHPRSCDAVRGWSRDGRRRPGCG